MATLILIVSFLALIICCVKGSIKIQGDVTVVGLFEIHEQKLSKCGSNVKINSVMTFEAIKWYLQNLNGSGSLPFNVGFEAFETCRLETNAAEVAGDLIHRVRNNETIAGIIGPEFSSEAEVISQILSSVQQDKRLVQVGYSTTAPALADSNKYPNFVRVVPNDNIQVEMMIKTMIKLEWNRIAIIYEDDIYGQNASKRLQERALDEGICIADVQAISVQNGINIDEINTILIKIVYKFYSREPISGFVLFGSTTSGNNIFNWLSNSKLSKTPAVMLSEAFSMDKSVFFDNIKKEVFSKAQGTLAFTPPVYEVTDFQTHWREIFQNVTKFNQESQTNPWLQEVFNILSQCNKEICSFQPLTDAVMNKTFSNQPLFISYAIQAAHILMKAIAEMYKLQCNTSVICNSFKTNFKPGNVVNYIKGRISDLQNDFKWRPSFQPNLNHSITIDSTGELLIKPENSIYEMYNYRTLDTEQQFKLMKVGDYINLTVLIDLERLRDYSDMEQPTQWPNIRKAQCPVDLSCTECIPLKSLQNGFIFEPGDFYVVGVVPVFDTDTSPTGCGAIRKTSGYQAAESIRFAVEKLNKKSHGLAGRKTGLIILNSCNSPTVIQHKIYQLHFNGLKISDDTVLQVADKIIGYIAELTSSVSIAVAEQLTKMKYVQISYASTSPSLSDRQTFPYFMRVVTPETSQVKAIVEIINQLEGKYIQVIHSATEYGEQGREHLAIIAQNNGICIAQNITFSDTDNENLVYQNLRRFPLAKIVVVILQSSTVEPLMSTLVKYLGKEFLFIGTHTWDRKTKMLEDDKNQVLLGSYSISFNIEEDKELLEHMNQISAAPLSINPWSMMYLQARMNCYFNLSFDKSQPRICTINNSQTFQNATLDYLDTFAYIATESLIMGASKFFQQKCNINAEQLCEDFRGDPRGLVKSIQNISLSLDQSGNTSKVFDANSDGLLGYNIYNIQKDPENPQRLTYVLVGKYPLQGPFIFEKEKIVYPADGDFISVCPNTRACEHCSSGTRPDQPADTVDVARIVLGIVVGILALAVTVLVIVVVFMCRRKPENADLYLHPSPNDDYQHIPLPPPQRHQ